MKKYRRVMCHDTEEWCKVCKKLTLGFKNDMRNLVNFNASSGKSENLYFDVLLLLKVYHVWAKKYGGVMHHNTEEWCKIWRRTYLPFEKWHEEFGEFWPNTRKFKICALMGPFWPKYIFELKSTEELCVNILKIYANFEGKLLAIS